VAVNQTAKWRCGPTGTYSAASNTNGGGFDSAISGAGTDYSNPANITNGGPIATGSAGTATGTTAFSDTVAANFTSAMVGNAIYISGTGLTTGWYFITAFSSSTAVTLDRTPGTGTTGAWSVGGMWIDFWTVPTLAYQPIVAGNQILVRGSGSGSVSTPDYTPNQSTNPHVAGSFGGTVVSGGGYIKVIGETNRVYVHDTQGWIYGSGGGTGPSYIWFENFYYWTSGANGFNFGLWLTVMKNCVIDQNGVDTVQVSNVMIAIGCESFSRVTRAGTSVAATGINFAAHPMAVAVGNNVHDVAGIGLVLNSGGGALFAAKNIVHNCSGDGILMEPGSNVGHGICINNTVDGNTGHGIEVVLIGAVACLVTGNLITNHTASGKFGISSSTNQIGYEDYNSFYGNTNGNVGGSSTSGAHDVTLGANPYTSTATENWAIPTTLQGTAFPAAWKQSLGGKTAPTSHIAPGAFAP
jgi:hypothetical protein